MEKYFILLFLITKILKVCTWNSKINLLFFLFSIQTLEIKTENKVKENYIFVIKRGNKNKNTTFCQIKLFLLNQSLI